jgi:peptidoglycan/xylan/chitin deacetylase (PgdA/CDA1 family)
MSKLIPDFVFRRLFDALSLSGSKLNTLIYHRVLPEPDPLRPWEIDAQSFNQHLEWISGVFNVLPLQEASEALHANKLPKRSLCITFDDGYLDNAEIALPLLKSHQMPATFFCTSAFIEGGMMWNDQVIEAIRHWPSESISISELALENLPLNTLGSRAKSAEAILNKLKYIEKTERANIAQKLFEESQADPGRQMMSAKEIRYLHNQGMEIGGHTHNHPILSNLNEDDARYEIEHNKRTLEAILDQKISSFAYPNGKPGKDFLSEHSQIVSNADYKIAVSTSPGVSNHSINTLQLPRFTPWDDTRDKFLLRLALNHTQKVSFT